MTADVELPAILRDIAAGRRNSVGDYWSRDYCNQAAAEIEALRAEVRELRKRQAGWERHVAAAGCEYVRDGEHDALVNRRAEWLRALLLEACDDGDEADADLLATLERARTAEARAERMAEALLELCNVIDGHEVPVAVEGKAAHARDALRDHEQVGAK